MSIAGILLSATMAGAQMLGQPAIAELARQTEASRASAETKKARKTYTNKDLKAVPVSEPDPATAAGAAAKPAGKETAEKTAAVAEGGEKLSPEEEAKLNAVPEGMWRLRAGRIRDQVAEVQEAIALLRAKPRSPTPEKQALDDKELARLNNATSLLAKQWAALESQAREAKINFGWLEPVPAFPR